MLKGQGAGGQGDEEITGVHPVAGGGPVTASVTGCSTWRRVLTSRKVIVAASLDAASSDGASLGKSLSWGVASPTRSSTVPAPRYPT